MFRCREGSRSGSQRLIVTTEAGSSAPFTVTWMRMQPGLLAPSSFDINGTQYAVALFSDGDDLCASDRRDFGR